MFLKQLYEVAIRTTKEVGNDGKLKIPMNWVIDEFAILPEIMDIDAIYSAARSRGIRINTFMQSTSQLRKKYGDDRSKSIMDNNTNIIYLGSGTDEVKDLFSKRAGDEIVYNKAKKDYVEREILTKERLNALNKGRSLFTSIEWNPYISKLPMYTQYTFANKPDYNIEERQVGKVPMFDIKQALELQKEYLLSADELEEALDKVWNEKEQIKINSINNKTKSSSSSGGRVLDLKRYKKYHDERTNSDWIIEVNDKGDLLRPVHMISWLFIAKQSNYKMSDIEKIEMISDDLFFDKFKNDYKEILEENNVDIHFDLFKDLVNKNFVESIENGIEWGTNYSKITKVLNDDEIIFDHYADVSNGEYDDIDDFEGKEK